MTPSLISDFIEYVKTFINSTKGLPVMVDNRDYMYTIEKSNQVTRKTNWKCRSGYLLKCKARATTIDNRIVKYFNEHNHDSEAQQIQFPQ